MTLQGYMHMHAYGSNVNRCVTCGHNKLCLPVYASVIYALRARIRLTECAVYIGL